MICCVGAVAAQPDQPHLSQAWMAMSSGDGLKGAIGKESYHISADGKFKAHMYEYPEQSCTKISLHDPTQLHHIPGGERNYYLGCDAVNCCYSDFKMKELDIEKSDGSARLHSLPMRIPPSSMRTLSL